ncbi:MAG: Permease of the drug/metabolite transporter superfamily [Hyphomicrobiales bacterium]|nr:Permease of the drug/metabolite transporter superfamily [Hyphomicrobiales bacterium]
MPANSAPSKDNLLVGIGLVLIAYIGFTAIDTSAKWLGRTGMPWMEFIFVRYLVHFLVIAILFLPQRGKALVRTGNLKIEVLRALFLLASTLCNFFAVQYLPLTVTGAIAFTMPLILCALSVPLLGEAVGWRRWTAIAVGFVGVLVIVRPGTEAFHPAALASLAGATMSAFYFISTRRLAGVDSAATQQFYAALVSVLCVAPFAFNGWVWPTQPVDWFFFGLIGLAGVFSHQIFSIAVRFAPATILAPFAYFQIIYAIASSWLIFNQPPSVWIFVGAPIVIGSGLYVWLRERQLQKPLTPVVAED